MNSVYQKLLDGFRWLLPSPFTIAVILTGITLLAAFFLTGRDQGVSYFSDLAGYWVSGLWQSPMLTFAFQMMLMLVLGHAIALSGAASLAINRIISWCRTGPRAVFLITLFTMLVALINWGLGLVFGAILVRETGRRAQQQGIRINYPLLGAAGYSGMMIWHGGFSGSAPLKVAEPGHFLEPVTGVIPVTETLFSPMNLTLTVAALTLLPLFMYFISLRSKSDFIKLPDGESVRYTTKPLALQGTERMDYARLFSILCGTAVLVAVFFTIIRSGNLSFSFITPDFINLVLLGSALLLHRNIAVFLGAVEDGMRSAAGILIQFPLYFGIMGIIQSSGLINLISDWFVELSGSQTFPFMAFMSAALVNVFVPSGGGQWAVQGPLMAEAANALHVEQWKTVMAVAYGDQLTNMLQPFWALPLLGITRLNARDILPYSVLLMLAGLLLFSIVLFIF